jgi:hypothetical protein
MLSLLLLFIIILLCYIFRYEGTVWDDVAQGRGVYSNEDGLVRFVFAKLWWHLVSAVSYA